MDSQPAGEAVDLIALARERRFRATTRATDMQLALYTALDALEREIASSETIRR